MQPQPRWIIIATVFTIIFICGSSCSYLSGYLRHRRHVEEAKASVLLENLKVMRRAIKQYTEDYKQAPAELNNLVEAGYLSAIPADPLTGSTTTWLLERENQQLNATRTQGIINVRSGAEGDDTDGVSYSKY